MPDLVHALSDPVDYVRAPAADALGAMGAKAGAAVAPLAAKLLTDDQGFVLASIAYAFGRYRPSGERRHSYARASIGEAAGWQRG